MEKKILNTLFAILIFSSCIGQTIVPYHHKHISYMGRIDTTKNTCIQMYWPGTSITLNFRGTEAKAVLKNEPGNTYFYAIVDGDESNAIKIKPDTNKISYTLASGLPYGKHTVTLFKLTDNTTITSFYGFELDDGAHILKSDKAKKRKIEFYGNSITAGHGVDVPEDQKDSGAPFFFNNYWTYAARTARYFDAQYSCIARSGIGLMVSWFPQIMPEIYDRINPNDSLSKWYFNRFSPNIVVVNLYQNDMWISDQPEQPQFKVRFGGVAPDSTKIIKSYQNFILKLRAEYPKASIICTLGSMNATADHSLWPGYLRSAVKGLNDPKILTHFFTYKNTSGHPKASEQKIMADELINFINKNIKW